MPGSCRDRLLVGAVALVLRGGLGMVFFGSIDLTNSVLNAQRLFDGQEVHLPYFPIIPTLIWLGGVLDVRTQLPVAFCFKLVPILFDVLLAMLLYDVQARRCPALSFRLALLYAISPIALLITSIHGQWDTICLFFLLLSLNLVDDPVQNRRTRLLAGGCFALSFLVKPLPAVCLPFLFPPLLPTEGRRSHLSQSLDTALGMATVVTVSFVLFWFAGCNPFRLCLEIVQYADQGVQIFGLPFAIRCHEWMPLKYRFWILAVLCWLAVAYHRGNLDRFESILFCFSFPLGVAGIGPQNLLWPVPFLLLTRKLRLGALYNLVTVVFLFVYYMMPLSSYIPHENMGAFAVLRGFSWLMPPLALGEGLPARLLPFFGNSVIPVCALAIAARSVGHRAESGHRAKPCDPSPRRPTWPYALYVAPLAVLAGSIALLYAVEDRSALRAVSVPIVKAKLARYDMEVSGSPDFDRSPLVIVGHYPCESYFNIASIFLIGAFAWSLASFRFGGEDLWGHHGDIGCTVEKEGEDCSEDCSPCGGM
jgi:hypothetical protein